jgi:hypothetical protein
MVGSLEELMVVKDELYGNLHGNKPMVVTTPNSQVSHDYPSIVAMPIIILRISA